MMRAGTNHFLVLSYLNSSRTTRTITPLTLLKHCPGHVPMPPFLEREPFQKRGHRYMPWAVFQECQRSNCSSCPGRVQIGEDQEMICACPHHHLPKAQVAPERKTGQI